MKPPATQERRRLRRYRTAHYTAQVRRRGLAALFRAKEAMVVDVNRRGLKLVSDKGYRLGQGVVLTLCSNAERIYGVQARVCHVSRNKGEFHVGLVFVEPNRTGQLSKATESLLASIEQVVIHQLH